MTNKIDVSECDFIEEGLCNRIDARDCDGFAVEEVTFCKDNPNCYYKQLSETRCQYVKLEEEHKRLSQQYEKLKEQFRTFTDIHNSTVKQYEALQKQYITVLDLAKKNSDSYEYCLKNLEEKIVELQK